MTAVFEQIFEMSLTAAVVIVVVMFIRLLLRKAPRKYSYALWSVAAFRLVCPVSFEAVFSLFTFTKQMELPEVTQIVTDPTPTVSPGYFDSVPPGYFDSVPAVSGSVSDYIDPDDFFTYPVTTPPAAETPTVTQINWLEVAAVIWLIGLAALLIYGVVSYARLRRRMSTAVLYADNIWQSDRVQSPFILGFVRPKIYLPFGLTMEQHRYVLAHETCHLERLDHIARPLSFLILAVHWFNPLVWAAYYMMGRDMEMSCDEKVLSTGESVKAYSTTLLSFAANRRFPSPSPLAFGESGVKSRIKNALNWKKPRTWVTIIAIIVCIVVIVVCAANPKEETDYKDVILEYCTTAVAGDLYDTVTIHGTETYGRKLSDAEKGTIAAYLNRLSSGDLKEWETDPHGDDVEINIMMTASCWLTYGDGRLVIHKVRYKDASVERVYHWEVDSDALKAFMADVTKLEYTPAAPETGYYRSAELLFLSSLSSAVGTDDSGYYYLLQGNELRLIHKSSAECSVHAADGDWQELSDEFLRKMEEGSFVLSRVGLWDTLRDERPTVRIYGDNKLLLNFGDELWVGTAHHNHSGNISLWDLYRLEKMAEEPILPVEELVTWHADLTHDGVDETIQIIRKTGETAAYCLDIRMTDGTDLWNAELYDWKTGWNGFYLYERDGKHYLLEWFPNGQQGWYSFAYRIYRLNEAGEPEIVEEDSLQYDLGAAGYRENILTVDVEPLRAFEAKINALLQDAQVLLVVDENRVVLGNPNVPVSDSWSSPADEWEESRQAYAAQLPLAWIGWEGDLNLQNCLEEQTKFYMGNYELAYVDSPKEIPTPAIGTTSGHFIYRVEYRPADYDADTRQLTWHDNEYFYLITHEDWGEIPGEEDDRWYFVGTLTEEELQSSYNTPDMLAQYDNDPYLAAVVETVNQWRDNQ